MKAFVAFCLGFSCSVMASPTGQVIYQWRDAQNQLHVSQFPPTDVEYQTIVVATQTKSAATTTPAVDTPAQTQNKQQKCAQATENLLTLNQDLPVFFVAEDGTQTPLNPTQIAEQRKLAETQIAAFCDEPKSRP